jgi:hypothetical protein
MFSFIMFPSFFPQVPSVGHPMRPYRLPSSRTRRAGSALVRRSAMFHSPTYMEEKKQHDVKLKFVREQIEREFVELKWIALLSFRIRRGALLPMGSVEMIDEYHSSSVRATETHLYGGEEAARRQAQVRPGADRARICRTQMDPRHFRIRRGALLPMGSVEMIDEYHSSSVRATEMALSSAPSSKSQNFHARARRTGGHGHGTTFSKLDGSTIHPPVPRTVRRYGPCDGGDGSDLSAFEIKISPHFKSARARRTGGHGHGTTFSKLDGSTIHTVSRRQQSVQLILTFARRGSARGTAPRTPYCTEVRPV